MLELARHHGFTISSSKDLTIKFIKKAI